jgi:hypothetical protein
MIYLLMGRAIEPTESGFLPGVSRYLRIDQTSLPRIGESCRLAQGGLIIVVVLQLPMG